MHKQLGQSIVKYLKPIFEAYDKDKNQALQKPQLKLLLADNLGVPVQKITQDQLNWHFTQIDQNGDGHITFSQYYNHFFGLRAKRALKDTKGNNQDQLIDKEQFRKLMEDTFKPLKIEITQEMVDWNFSQIDVDNSGRISFDEYLKFIKKYNP